MATGYRTPSVLLFGPTPPPLWGPPVNRPQHIVLWAGKVGDPHANHPDPGLLLISAERVITEALSLLRGIHAGEYRAS